LQTGRGKLDVFDPRMAERDESAAVTSTAKSTRPPSSFGIFLNYRRDDAEGQAGRLYDALVLRFGEDAVFMDVDRIRGGRNWREEIKNALGSSDACLVVIGRDWLTIADEGGRRLDQIDDACRLEIEEAFARKIQVIPVLVEGARMPDRRTLPESIASLADIHAFDLSHARYRYDVGRLCDELEALAAEKAKREAPRAETTPRPKPVPPPDAAPKPTPRAKADPKLPISKLGLSPKASVAVKDLGARELGDLKSMHASQINRLDDGVIEEIEQELAKRKVGRSAWTHALRRRRAAPTAPSAGPQRAPTAPKPKTNELSTATKVAIGIPLGIIGAALSAGLAYLVLHYVFQLSSGVALVFAILWAIGAAGYAILKDF
jgi:TIR domain